MIDEFLHFTLFCEVVGSFKLADSQRVVSSTFWIVQILVHPEFDLVSLLELLEATEPVPEPVPQMALELINMTIISFQYSKQDKCKSYILFHVTITSKKMKLCLNDAEILLN